MFKIYKTSALFDKCRTVTVNNVCKFFSEKFSGRSPFERKPEVDTNLPSVVQNEDIKVHNLPYVGVSRFRNPINVPMMMSSFFTKSFNDLAKEMMLFEPINSPESTTVSAKQPFNTSAEVNDQGMKIAIEMKGFKEEDINVRVEGPWLVVEGRSTVTVPETEGGGLHIRHVIRRYEVPPNSDVSNIKSNFKMDTLTITVPSLTPKVTSEK
ncbi:uncharacterized protein [Halyomorpha halys]|uniref:uncharacterized protein n=1 Tax=Halyomorpha halys TaxID=286706 RepID=UPI0006D4C981|nr:uncharacterized protein LOC106688813 [Halyomorpha halys]